jgi:hypothetical protein
MVLSVGIVLVQIDLIEAFLVSTTVSSRCWGWTINAGLVDVITLTILTSVLDWLILLAAMAAFNWVVSGVHEETAASCLFLSLG